MNVAAVKRLSENQEKTQNKTDKLKQVQVSKGVARQRKYLLDEDRASCGEKEKQEMNVCFYFVCIMNN